MSATSPSPPWADGVPKASGQTRYADDLVVPDLWFGATLRSPYPHARIESLRWLPEKAPAGAVCVTAADLSGPNGVLLLDDRWPILGDGFVRHVGEPVAIAAAPSKIAARQALEAIDVEYEPLAAALDITTAEELEPHCSLELDCGDVELALEDSHVVVEGTYRTGHQEHVYIECQAMTAWWEKDGSVVVQGSMQCPYFVHKSLLHALELPADRVIVKATPVGGGFGGKEDFPSLLALHVALLSRACGHPVRIAYNRQEDIVATTKRHPSLIRHRTGVDEEGRLRAVDIEIVLDGGAYGTLSPVVLSRAVLHAGGPYRCADVRIRGRVLRTHTAPNGAFRGFGAPQVQFAIERQMDRVGRRLGLDPLEIRLRNVLEPGDRLPTGQKMDASCSARLCLERAAEESRFRERWLAAERRRATADDDAPSVGLGLSLSFHGAGLTGNGERTLESEIGVALREDGRLEILTAAVDMGQGCSAVLPLMAAEASGLALADLVLAEPDTARVPDSGPSVASRTTMIVGDEVAKGVVELRDRILAWWGDREGIEAELVVEAGLVRAGSETGRPFREVARQYFGEEGPVEVRRRHVPPEWQIFDEETYQGVAYPTYAFGADVAEVAVDPDTLEVSPRRVTAVCEVGRVLHPTLCRGQVEGGTLQAVGWALREEMKLAEGRYLNDRLATYLVPTIKDGPEIEVHLLERPWEGGFAGAKGVGELPMDGGAPAILAAVENAIGIEIRTIPATPERLLEGHLAGELVMPFSGPDGAPPEEGDAD